MYVGVDIGTQSLKAVVTDARLQVLGEAGADYAPHYPRPGWAEQAPALWEAALAPTVGRALAAAGAKPEAVAALGVCGQLDGCVPTDADGCALGPCIIWSDRRAAGEMPALAAERVRALTGVVLDATHMAAKIRWLKHHHPEARRIARFHQPVSYLVSRLTGEHVFDHGLASTTMLYSLQRATFEPELLSAFETAADELPAIRDAGDCAGRLHARGAVLAGLPAGLPVAVGTGDDYSNPLGAGVVAPGPVACAVGTAEVVGALHDAPSIDVHGLLETHRYAGGAFFIENPGWLSGGAVAWLLDILDLRDPRELDRLAEEVPAGADGVLFVPALSGAMAPEWIASARGCFYGLAAGHRRGHLARALLEGCAYAMRDVVSRLREMGVATDTILLLGGGARSRTWAQIRADLTGLPVEVAAAPDTSPLGAALLAALAAGGYADLRAGAHALRGASAVLEPDPRNREPYDAAYHRYRQLFESLRPMYGG